MFAPQIIMHKSVNTSWMNIGMFRATISHDYKVLTAPCWPPVKSGGYISNKNWITFEIPKRL